MGSCLNPFRNTNVNEWGKRCASGLNCCPLTASVLLELINSAMARMFRTVLICTVDKIDYNAIGKQRVGGGGWLSMLAKIYIMLSRGFLMSAANSIYFPKAIGVEKNLLNMMCNTALECW